MSNNRLYLSTTSDLAPRIESEIVSQAVRWRHDFHAHPELMFDVHRTATKVAEILESIGCDQVETGIGVTGVVGVINGQENTTGRTLGIRADMDALPIHEAGDTPHRSKNAGVMHACGHDGHCAVLLGSAAHLARNRDFDGKCVVFFQPAEEGGGGAKVMIDDGVLNRFDIQEIYGLHSWPGAPVGSFQLADGVVLMASDRFEINVCGKGGHAARPHECIDSILIAAQIVTALHSITPRSLDPSDAAVMTVSAFHAGNAFNVIPDSVSMRGTVRTVSADARDVCEERVRGLSTSIAIAHGATCEVDYHRGYPPTVNHREQARFLGDIAVELVGEENVDRDIAPIGGSEDFSYYLRERPGAYIFMGNGNSAPLHHPEYDFDDEALLHGMQLWSRLVRSRLRATD